MAASDPRALPRRTRVAVALGVGGARGYAHIGVLQVLDERGYDVVSVAGSSMGALVGGLYAAGRLDAYVDWVRDLTHRDVLRLYDLSPRAPGAIRAERAFARLGEFLGEVRIEDLPLDFTAVATDLGTGEERWLREGPLTAAIRASAALPGFMTPVVIQGRLLADGGLLNPLPLAATVPAGADLTVAVAVSGREPPPAAVPGRRAGRREARRRTAVRVLHGTADDVAEPVLEALPAGLRLLDVVELSLQAVRAGAVRQALAAHPPDVLITVPRSACRTFDFHKADELTALGRRLAVEALDRGQERGQAVDG